MRHIYVSDGDAWNKQVLSDWLVAANEFASGKADFISFVRATFETGTSLRATAISGNYD